MIRASVASFILGGSIVSLYGIGALFFGVGAPDLMSGASAQYSAGVHEISCGTEGAGFHGSLSQTISLETTTIVSCMNGQLHT